MKNRSTALLLLLLALGCGQSLEEATPLPRGYFRIELPAREYRPLEQDCPYTFEYNQNARWEKDRQPCWGDLYYPDIKARLELTYKRVTEENLPMLLEEGHKLAYKHTVKAAGIGERLFSDPDRNVHGILYRIDGEAASNSQFFMTDSTQHYLRGVLYFYAEPNVDSLAPVKAYMHEEIIHLIETLKWQNSSP